MANLIYPSRIKATVEDLYVLPLPYKVILYSQWQPNRDSGIQLLVVHIVYKRGDNKSIFLVLLVFL
jgi:hypothetical protein